jgi:hypothetical protein
MYIYRQKFVTNYHMSLLPAHVDGHLRGCANMTSMLTGSENLSMIFYGGHLHGASKHDMLMKKYRSKRDEVTHENVGYCTTGFIKFFHP